MKKFIIILIIILGAGYFFIYPIFRGIKPVFLGEVDKQDIVESIGTVSNDPVQTQFGPFTVHPDFKLEVFSDEVTNPRVMIFDSKQNIIVSEPSESRVSIIDSEGVRKTLVSDLNQPHGLALYQDKLYIAETGQVLVYDYDSLAQEVSNKLVLLDLPSGGRHWTRTIAFGPDNNLYISVGSSCNICIEEDWRRIKILQYNLETQELIEYASGLRNSVFFTWHPGSKKLYATEMGRDLLGDDLPPDEINIVEQGKDYGFPYCYGDNFIDPEFTNHIHCFEEATSSFIDLQAHESPLGIAFHGDKDDMIVALHGSWNRPEPVGYKVIRFLGDDDYETRETIMEGFLQENGTSIGRPAGVLVSDQNEIYISDDKADIIYKLIAR